MFTDELVRREAFEDLQSSPEVVGADEGDEVVTQLVMIVVGKAFGGRVLDRAVHSFNLAVRPRVLDLGQPVLKLMLAADPVEDVLEGLYVPIMIGELDAVIGEHDVEPVGHGGDEIAQYGSYGHFPGLTVQFNESKFGCAVNAYDEPPRVYQRVVCSITRRPCLVCSGLHRTPPLLLRAGRMRWGRANGGCYTSPPVIPPFLTGCICKTYAAIFSFCAGVMPPMPMLGRSLL